MSDSGSDNLRDELLELLMSSQHAPRDTHHGETGECLQCPWPLHALPPDDIADVLTAEVERRVAAAKDELIETASDLAKSMADNEPDGYYSQACFEVAAAIRVLASGQEGAQHET